MGNLTSQTLTQLGQQYTINGCGLRNGGRTNVYTLSAPSAPTAAMVTSPALASMVDRSTCRRQTHVSAHMRVHINPQAVETELPQLQGPRAVRHNSSLVRVCHHSESGLHAEPQGLTQSFTQASRLSDRAPTRPVPDVMLPPPLSIWIRAGHKHQRGAAWPARPPASIGAGPESAAAGTCTLERPF